MKLKLSPSVWAAAAFTVFAKVKDIYSKMKKSWALSYLPQIFEPEAVL